MTNAKLLKLLEKCLDPLERLSIEGYYRCDREGAVELIEEIETLLRQSKEGCPK